MATKYGGFAASKALRVGALPKERRSDERVERELFPSQPKTPVHQEGEQFLWERNLPINRQAAKGTTPKTRIRGFSGEHFETQDKPSGPKDMPRERRSARRALSRHVSDEPLPKFPKGSPVFRTRPHGPVRNLIPQPKPKKT
jgi:hypothetical protein